MEAEVLVPYTNPNKFLNITGDHKLNKGLDKKRDMKNVTHIVLHQTACRLGVKPKRWYDIACHCGVLRDGTVLYVNDLQHYVWQANGFNNYSIGIEIDGHFPGIVGDSRTIWKDGGSTHVVTQEQIESTKNLLLWIYMQGIALGGNFEKLVAHRQSSSDRVADPGSEVWNAIAPWAMDQLGLEVPWYETTGSGVYLPRQWDIRSLFGWNGLDRTGTAMLQIIHNRLVDKTKLEIDGKLGVKTRIGIRDLNRSLGFDQFEITHDTLSMLVKTQAYIDLTKKMAMMVDQYNVPAHLRGADFLPVLQTEYK